MRLPLRSLCVVALLQAAAIARAGAQVVSVPPGPPRSIPTSASVTIGGTFDASPSTPPLTQTSQQGNPCNPGFCASGSIVVKANQKWQAQVRVKPSVPTSFYVNWIVQPAMTQVRLNSTTWYTFATNSSATPGTTLALLFNANKVTGNQGVVPTAAQLSTYLEYRVIALP